MDFFRPDGKTQVSFEYVDGKPIRINNVVVSTQHAASASQADIIEAVKRTVIRPVLEPSGLFVRRIAKSSSTPRAVSLSAALWVTAA